MESDAVGVAVSSLLLSSPPYLSFPPVRFAVMVAGTTVEILLKFLFFPSGDLEFFCLLTHKIQVLYSFVLLLDLAVI